MKLKHPQHKFWLIESDGIVINNGLPAQYPYIDRILDPIIVDIHDASTYQRPMISLTSLYTNISRRGGATRSS